MWSILVWSLGENCNIIYVNISSRWSKSSSDTVTWFCEIPMKWCSYEITCTIVMNVYLLPDEIKISCFHTRPETFTLFSWHRLRQMLRWMDETVTGKQGICLWLYFSIHDEQRTDVVHHCTTRWRHVCVLARVWRTNSSFTVCIVDTAIFPFHHFYIRKFWEKLRENNSPYTLNRGLHLGSVSSIWRKRMSKNRLFHFYFKFHTLWPHNEYMQAILNDLVCYFIFDVSNYQIKYISYTHTHSLILGYSIDFGISCK